MPIQLSYVDGPTRTSGFGPSFLPSGDASADMDLIRPSTRTRTGSSQTVSEPRGCARKSRLQPSADHPAITPVGQAPASARMESRSALDQCPALSLSSPTSSSGESFGGYGRQDPHLGVRPAEPPVVFAQGVPGSGHANGQDRHLSSIASRNAPSLNLRISTGLRPGALGKDHHRHLAVECHLAQAPSPCRRCHGHRARGDVLGQPHQPAGERGS